MENEKTFKPEIKRSSNRKKMPTLYRPHIYVKNPRVKAAFDEISNISEFVETCVLYYLDQELSLDELSNKPLTKKDISDMICEQFNAMLLNQIEHLSSAVVTLGNLNGVQLPIGGTPLTNFSNIPTHNKDIVRKKSNSILDL